jgi:hypothetical protein
MDYRKLLSMALVRAITTVVRITDRNLFTPMH